MNDIDNDYISRLKIMILVAREDRAKAQTRIDTLEEVLNDYETLIIQRSEEKK